MANRLSLNLYYECHHLLHHLISLIPGNNRLITTTQKNVIKQQRPLNNF